MLNVGVFANFPFVLDRHKNNKTKHNYVNNLYNCDVVVSIGDMSVAALSSTKKKIFVICEPQDILKYPSLSAFSHVISYRNDLINANIIRKHSPVPWHVGYPLSGDASKILMFDSIKNLGKGIEKKDKILILISNKKMFNGHIQRDVFLRRCKDILGDMVDVVEHPWEDKSILQDYKYHIAIENSFYNDYWTEKLADPILCETFTFYCGAPNINEYFPNGICSILMNDSDIAKIKLAIENNIYQKEQENLLKNKNDMLFKYNILNYLDEVIDEIL